MKDEIKKYWDKYEQEVATNLTLETYIGFKEWLDANYKEPERLSMEKVLGIFENELYAEKYTELNGDVYYVVEGKQKAAEQICKLIPEGEGEAVDFAEWLNNNHYYPSTNKSSFYCWLKDNNTKTGHSAHKTQELYSLFLTDKAHKQ